MPLRTTARMTALSPGQSPPPVRTPMRICRPTYLRAGRRHGLVTAVAVAAVLGLAACGSDHHPRAGRSGALTVYSSLPRAGLSARAAAAVSDGERLALADAGGRAGGRRVR